MSENNAATPSRTSISFSEQRDRMNDSERQALPLGAITNLEKASRVSRGHDFSPGAFDVLELALEKIVGHFRLDEIVYAGTAATPSAFRQLHQLQIRDLPKHLTRLSGDLLPMTKMTRLVVSHRLRWCLALRRRRDADLRKPLVNVLHLRIPSFGSTEILWVVGQQLGVMFQVRSAACRIRDDRVISIRRELVDLLSGNSTSFRLGICRST